MEDLRKQIAEAIVNKDLKRLKELKKWLWFTDSKRTMKDLLKDNPFIKIID